jgi:transcriptional regulator with XRE-family HTH domain
LAKKTGIAESNLSRLEHGKHMPSLKTLQTVAKALGVGWGELISTHAKEPALAEA